MGPTEGRSLSRGGEPTVNQQLRPETKIELTPTSLRHLRISFHLISAIVTTAIWKTPLSSLSPSTQVIALILSPQAGNHCLMASVTPHLHKSQDRNQQPQEMHYSTRNNQSYVP